MQLGGGGVYVRGGTWCCNLLLDFHLVFTRVVPADGCADEEGISISFSVCAWYSKGPGVQVEEINVNPYKKGFCVKVSC